MSLVLTDPVRPAASRRSTSAAFQIDVSADWGAAVAEWSTMADEGRALPFQQTPWLDSWYQAFAPAVDVKPLIVTVRDRQTNKLALALPLVTRSEGRMRIAEFADLNLTDYNAPVLGTAAPRDPETAQALWDTLCRSLDGIDLIRLKKMPVVIGDQPNPLALISSMYPCQLNGNLVVTGDDFDAYRHSLGRTVRKELERSWRVFSRHPGATFRVISDVTEALRLLTVMEAQQSTRMNDLGQRYILNEETPAAFYRNLITAGLREGFATMTALSCGDEVVAALLGVGTGQRYIMIRITNAGGQWSNSSPGRLIIERTMAHLHAEGVRHFDFSIGNYAYKRRFGVTPFALVDKTAALSWRGSPSVMRESAIQWLRRHPALDTRLRRALGQQQHPGEE
jgi:CelD/BcsL family acetyltransferase involved in cellulose biosynthesis